MAWKRKAPAGTGARFESVKHPKKSKPRAAEIARRGALKIERLKLRIKENHRLFELAHPATPPQQWPPNYPPNLSHEEAKRIKWVIDEAEKTLIEASAAIPKSDVAGHDEQLKLLLFDFVSVVYCAFLEEAKELLRRGEWTIGEHGPLDFSVIAGLLIRDVGEGAFQKFRALAASAENKIEWKTRVFAHSELVWAVLNSVRVRQKGPDLIASAKAHLFGAKNEQLYNPEKLREDISKAAGTTPTPIGDLEELRKRGSLSQKQAATELACSDRNIRAMVTNGKLTKSGKGRIVVDEKFCARHKLTHSPVKK
jgi:hypothetical protein